MALATSQPTTRFALADGRSLDLWLDDAPGAEDLTPLVFMHGTPGSGVGFEPFAVAARERGLRSIAWSRPGYGSSTRQPGRSVADVAADTRQVLDHLGCERAYVIGHSGGGPHALAAAALLPDRVTGTGLVASVAPFEAEGLEFLEGMGADNHEEFGAALRGEGELVAFLAPARRTILEMTGDGVIAMFGSLVDDADKRALTGDYAEFVAVTMGEGVRESTAGWIDDDLAFMRPWGFDLQSIRGLVHVWQGGQDRMVPYAHGKWLAAHLGNACVHLHDDHGHLSIAVAGYGAILDSLVQGT